MRCMISVGYWNQFKSDDFCLARQMCISPVDMKEGEVIFPQILKVRTMFHDVKERLCHAVGYRNDGFLGAEACPEAIILGSVVRILAFDCGPRDLDEYGFDHLSFNGALAAFSFACTFVIPWGDSAPGGECFDGIKCLKTGPHFGNNCPCRHFSYSGNRRHPFNDIVTWCHESPEALIYKCNLFVESIDGSEQRFQGIALVIPEEPFNCIIEFEGLFLPVSFTRQLAPQALLHVGERNGLLAEQQTDKILASGSEDVAQHGTNFNVRHFKQLVDAPFEVAHRIDEHSAYAAPVAPLSHLLFGDEATPYESVSEKSCKPFAVGHVSLSTRQMLGMAGIDENYPNRSFQNIEDRPPVDSGYSRWRLPGSRYGEATL